MACMSPHCRSSTGRYLSHNPALASLNPVGVLSLYDGSRLEESAELQHTRETISETRVLMLFGVLQCQDCGTYKVGGHDELRLQIPTMASYGSAVCSGGERALRCRSLRPFCAGEAEQPKCPKSQDSEPRPPSVRIPAVL